MRPSAGQRRILRCAASSVRGVRGEELDTSWVYQDGNCEAVIGRVPAGQSLRVGTKYHPSLGGWPIAQMAQSLIALSRDAMSIFYIHMPSTLLMLEDTLAEMNDCHAARQFSEFGLSNFPAWQVVEICQYCQRNGYVMPTVYRGVYNALNRTAEYELIPVPSELRHPLVHPMAPQRAAFSRGRTKRGVRAAQGCRPIRPITAHQAIRRAVPPARRDVCRARRDQSSGEPRWSQYSRGSGALDPTTTLPSTGPSATESSLACRASTNSNPSWPHRRMAHCHRR